MMKVQEPVFSNLDPDVLSAKMDEFVSIAHRNIADEYWQREQFLSPATNKWHLSFYLKEAGTERILGFIIASDKGETVHIHKFIVDSEFQGRGLGKKMFNHFLSLSKKDVSLKVNIENTGAIKFYERLGFAVSEQSPGKLLMTYKRDV